MTTDQLSCVCETDYRNCPHHPLRPWIPKANRTADDWEYLYLTSEARRRGAERERDRLRELSDRLTEIANERGINEMIIWCADCGVLIPRGRFVCVTPHAAERRKSP